MIHDFEISGKGRSLSFFQNLYILDPFSFFKYISLVLYLLLSTLRTSNRLLTPSPLPSILCLPLQVMLQVHEERGKHGSDPDVLVKRVFQVLYATSDDKIVVTDEGEVLGGGDNGDEEGGAVHEQEGDDDNEHLDNEVHEEEEFHESNQSSSGTANAGGPEELMEKEFMNHGHNRPPSPEEELLTEF